MVNNRTSCWNINQFTQEIILFELQEFNLSFLYFNLYAPKQHAKK